MNMATPIRPNLSPGASSRSPREIPAEAVVTYDSERDCYDYNAPGYHRQVCRLNPWKEGGQAALAVGVPSMLGAIETASLGLVNSSLINLAVSPAAGALVGGAWAGHAAWRETGQNPLYTGLAAMLGGAAGTVALPLLKAPGTFAGFGGALAAAGAAGIGVALWSAHHNREADAQALAHGYQPQV
jgi:hypothetical protein